MKRHSSVLMMTTTVAAAALLAGCSSSATPEAASGTAGAAAFETISDGVLRVGTVTDNKPYSYIEDGVNAGLDIDLVQEFADRNDLEVQFVQTEFSSLIPNVVSGQLDLAAASISITDERKETVDFSDPYMVGPIAVMTKSGSDITDDTASLKGVRLGLIQGTIQDTYAEEHGFGAEIVRFPDNNSGVAAMKTGSIDAFFMDAPLAESYIADDPSLELPIVIFDDQAPYGIAFSKDNPGLTEAFDAELEDLIADGSLEEMQEKFLPSLPVAEQFMPTS
jgi:polar amino acid transport system substrate-binding protein